MKKLWEKYKQIIEHKCVKMIEKLLKNYDKIWGNMRKLLENY